MTALTYEHPLADDLLMSFQRYPHPGPDGVRVLPRSHGALPVLLVAPGRLLVPVPDGEAAWLGLVRPPLARPWRVQVLATLSDGSSHDAAGVLHLPPEHALEGLARGNGSWQPLARAPAGPGSQGVRLLRVRAWPATDDVPAASWEVELVDEESFAAAGGGRVPAVSPDAAYGGWRLP